MSGSISAGGKGFIRYPMSPHWEYFRWSRSVGWNL